MQLTDKSPPSISTWIDLTDLESRPLHEILEEARKLYNNMKIFEKQCLKEVSRDVPNLVVRKYHLALLKFSTALAEKLKEQVIKDPFVEFIVGYYTMDEKNPLRELEKFSKLDPNVTPPERLADIIVAEEGEIYHLVKEAVIKDYVDLKRALKAWESELKIRNYLTHAFNIVYQSRFYNIINAIEHLLNQQPCWLKRLIKDYEAALLGSAEIRKRFEERLREVLVNERARLEESLRKLEEENRELHSRIERLVVELATS